MANPFENVSAKGAVGPLQPQTVTLNEAEKAKLVKALLRRRYGRTLPSSPNAPKPDPFNKPINYDLREELAFGSGKNIDIAVDRMYQALKPQQREEYFAEALGSFSSNDVQTLLGEKAQAIITAQQDRKAQQAQLKAQQQTQQQFESQMADALKSQGLASDVNKDEWKPLAVGLARQYGVPLDVVFAIIDIESSGDPEAQSPMNVDANGNPIGRAQGLMQVMPFNFPKGLTEEQMRDPRVNLATGIMMLRQKYEAYGDWDKAAAAYFGAIDKNGNITGASDVGGATGNSYVAKFNAARQRQRDAIAAMGGGVAGPSTQSAAAGQGAAATMDADSILAEMKALVASGKPFQRWDEGLADFVSTPEGDRYAALKDLYTVIGKGNASSGGYTIGDKLAELEKALGRKATPDEIAQLFGTASDPVQAGNLAARREELAYRQKYDADAMSWDKEKERTQLQRWLADNERMLAQLEQEAQRSYLQASKWMVPEGQSAPVYEGKWMKTIDPNKYLVPMPNFNQPVDDARARIAQQIANMKAGG